MITNILIGGQAGQGPNIVSKIIGNILVRCGYSVFVSRDYGSVIRGGHNFNTLTFSDNLISSNIKKVDILVALDKDTRVLHDKELDEHSVIIENENEENMYFAGRLVKLLGLEFELLKDELKKLKNLEDNLRNSKKGYDEGETKFNLKVMERKLSIMDGTHGIAEGAIKSGLDVYYSYPMTPSTPLLFELAERQIENNFFVFQPENEIAVINAAIGSAMTGAKSMVGTSGGGFDLMTEALSLTGIAEVPLVIYLAQRSGPGTGMPTYTYQGDLNTVRHSGHGEFSRMVFAPGDPIESHELVSQAFYFSQKYRVPCIILSDKHLAESIYTTNETPIITNSQKSTTLARYNSYEHDERGVATENADIVRKNFEKRLQKQKEIEAEARKFQMFKLYGNKSKNLIVFWGSTKGVVLDALRNINACALQIIYIEPFPTEIKKELEASNVIIVENNSTSLLSNLIAEKTGILVPDKSKILKYDGRQFYSDELSEEMKRRLV